MRPSAPPLLGLLLVGQAAASVVHLSAPSGVPANASGILDRRLASLSIEFAFLPDFGGNSTHPNLLTKVRSLDSPARGDLTFPIGAYPAPGRENGRWSGHQTRRYHRR
jgi:hypothetical protein